VTGGWSSHPHHGRTLYFLLHISASSGIFDLPKIPHFVLARPIFIIFIPVDRLRSFPVLPHQQHSPSDGVQASIREKWFTRFPSMYRLGVTNSKKAYTSFLPASISAGFLHFDTAWRRLSYTLYDFLHRATSPDILIGLYKNN
jgi:hypothetical protein